MVTNWSPRGAQWTRPWAGLLRLFGLATLLFGLVYAHSVSTEGIAGHINASAAATSQDVANGQSTTTVVDAAQGAKVAAPDSHHDDHAPTHPAQECTPGQPQQGVTLGAPCPAPLSGEVSAKEADIRHSSPGKARATAPSPMEPRTSNVLQI
ncbi:MULTISPECIES: hypothetical protein [Streptomyces]|uniref:hypothetical protein n=1 Tax=Streptomyces TaxID=1883 RepID=UPI00345F54E1